MRIALGLFHFNIQYVAGDLRTYHRYATQAIVPFLQLIAEDSRYCVSFEIAGNGLEFLAKFYPEAISLLRQLIDSGNIELISATYAPTLWVAFPTRDLRKSIELNRRVLSRLGLRSAPIFFAQEAFFGNGLREIDDLFSVALCKEDYVAHYRGSLNTNRAYRLSSLKILIGGGHVRGTLDNIHRGAEVPINCEEDGTVPFWYHMGSGHHLVCPTHPHAWSRFFADEDWIHASRQFFQQLIEKGLQFGTIMQYADTLASANLEPLPYLPEGSWNAGKSDGVYAWMGRHAHVWEADAELLGLVWRGRNIIRKLAEFVEYPSVASDSRLEEEILEAWRLLILAEASDPLGWEPLRGEVESARNAGEEAIRYASSLLLRLSMKTYGTRQRLCRDRPLATPLNSFPYGDEHVRLVGCTGVIEWRPISTEEFICDLDFAATASSCGVEFMRGDRACSYSPSCSETTVQVLDPAEFSCRSIYLPLANGYISLSDEWHLIRINAFGQVAARICSDSRWISFLTSGNQAGRKFHWRFLVMHTTSDRARTHANSVNYI